MLQKPTSGELRSDCEPLRRFRGAISVQAAWLAGKHFCENAVLHLSRCNFAKRVASTTKLLLFMPQSDDRINAHRASSRKWHSSLQDWPLAISRWPAQSFLPAIFLLPDPLPDALDGGMSRPRSYLPFCHHSRRVLLQFLARSY
jgi:hypothetical protein